MCLPRIFPSVSYTPLTTGTNFPLSTSRRILAVVTLKLRTRHVDRIDARNLDVAELGKQRQLVRFACRQVGHRGGREDQRKKEAEEVLQNAQRHMALLSELGLDNARVYSLKGAFYGFQIMLEPVRAPKLGRLSMEANDKALKLDPEEPQVWLERANIDYTGRPYSEAPKRKRYPSMKRLWNCLNHPTGVPGRTGFI